MSWCEWDICDIKCTVKQWNEKKYVCMYLCMYYVCLYVLCMYVCMYACIMYVLCIYVCIYVCMYVYVCMCVCVCVCVCVCRMGEHIKCEKMDWACITIARDPTFIRKFIRKSWKEISLGLRPTVLKGSTILKLALRKLDIRGVAWIRTDQIPSSGGLLWTEE